LAGRGDPAAAATLAALPEGISRDGWAMILATGPAIDILGDEGDVANAVSAYDEAVEAVTRLWHVATFPAQVRLGALVLRHPAGRAATASGPERAGLVAAGARLAEHEQAVTRRREELDRPDGPEGVAWTARHRAEH